MTVDWIQSCSALGYRKVKFTSLQNDQVDFRSGNGASGSKYYGLKWSGDTFSYNWNVYFNDNRPAQPQFDKLESAILSNILTISNKHLRNMHSTGLFHLLV